MISGLAKSEVKPREYEIFATAMSFGDELLEIPMAETTKATFASYDRKRAKKNRTTE